MDVRRRHRHHSAHCVLQRHRDCGLSGRRANVLLHRRRWHRLSGRRRCRPHSDPDGRGGLHQAPLGASRRRREEYRHNGRPGHALLGAGLLFHRPIAPCRAAAVAAAAPRARATIAASSVAVAASSVAVAASPVAAAALATAAFALPAAPHALATTTVPLATAALSSAGAAASHPPRLRQRYPRARPLDHRPPR